MLEPSWSKGGVFSHRFGQVGSMPARGYMPFLAIEDTKNSVSWGSTCSCRFLANGSVSTG